MRENEGNKQETALNSPSKNGGDNVGKKKTNHMRKEKERET